MTRRLKRYYGLGHLHFITFSCYRRSWLLAEAWRRNLFLRVLEEVRRQFHFKIVGYVLMPNHVHLLIGEPELGDPSGVVQMIKQKTAKRILGRTRRRHGPGQQLLWPEADAPAHIWQRRFYDFNVYTDRKRQEKLRYMHNNPVEWELCYSPADWVWSSYRYYRFGEQGTVVMNLR